MVQQKCLTLKKDIIAFLIAAEVLDTPLLNLLNLRQPCNRDLS